MQIRRTRRLVVATAALALLATACGDAGDGGDATPAAGTDEGAVTDGNGEASGVSADDFDAELVEAAQEEGQVVLYAGGHTRPGLEQLTADFEETFGISVTSNREDSGSIVQSVEAELEAGNLNADLVSLTDAPSMLRWAAEGVITEVDVPNADQITDGFYETGEPMVPYSLVALGIMYNDAANEAPTSWDEFAESQEGRIILANPSASGTALMFFHMMDDLAGPEWLENLAERDVTVTDSALTLSQMTVTGEADYGAPAIESAVLSAAEEGEPLVTAFPEEGVPAFTSQLAVFEEATNPAAAELFLQFHLHPDVQASLTELGARSVLDDAPEPDDGADLSQHEVYAPDYEQLDAEAEELRERFDELFN
jgi:iron(III) transport system substrate-binding protein